MEPVKGGMLATPPEPVQKIFKEAEPEHSVASWGVRFAANLEGVIAVLSGMSSVEQMKDNLSYMKNFNGLSAAQEEVIKKAQEELSRISGTFTSMNYLTLYGDKGMAKHQEEWLVGGHGLKSASECIKCGKCEEACPQHIHIREELEKAAQALG